MCLSLYQKAKEGDVKAFRAVADVLGELGAKKIEVSEPRYTVQDIDENPGLIEVWSEAFARNDRATMNQFGVGCTEKILSELWEYDDE